MEAMNRCCMKSIQMRAFFWIGFFCFGVGANLNSQNSPQAAKHENDLKIRVGVDEVRVDAVVVDMKGHPITDLTADDFEVYQDGKPPKRRFMPIYSLLSAAA